MNKRVCPIIAFLLLPANAQAGIVVAPECEVSAAVAKVACSFPTTEIANGISEIDGHGNLIQYLTDFSLNYNFDCRGNPVGVVFSSGKTHVPVNFTSENASQTAFIQNGSGALSVTDLARNTTAHSTLVGDCTVRVKEIRLAPSFETIVRWNEQAHQQAVLIKGALDFYLLASSFDNLREFTRSKLDLMKEKLEDLAQASPTDLHLKMLLATIHAAIRGAPEPYSPTDLVPAEQTLLNFARAELLRLRNTGLELAARSERWEVAMNQALKDTIEEANTHAGS